MATINIRPVEQPAININLQIEPFEIFMYSF